MTECVVVGLMVRQISRRAIGDARCFLGDYYSQQQSNAAGRLSDEFDGDGGVVSIECRWFEVDVAGD